MLTDELLKSGLTRREAEIAGYVNKGLSNKEVGNALFVTEKTVKFHLTNIYKKLGVKSRAQLIVWCAPRMTFEEPKTLDASGGIVADSINLVLPASAIKTPIVSQ